MMREMKIRGWHLRTESWCYGVYPWVSHSPSCLNMPAFFRRVNDGLIKNISTYTSRNDSRGIEIYEGDVIEACGEYPAEICFKFGTFLLRHINHVGINGVSISDVATDRYEVIGNIYENPELIKEGKE